MVRRDLPGPDPGPGARLAGDRRRTQRARARPHRLGQDARRVPGRDRPAAVRARAAAGPSAAGSSTSRRSRRSRWTWSATCACRSRQSRRVAARRGETLQLPVVAIRTGDTPQDERARMLRQPPDILITTPESLFLVLTSRARALPGLGRDGDRGRDPRRGRDEARRAPRAVARAARAGGAPTAAAHRPLGDAAAARGGRALPGRRRGREGLAAAPGHDRGRRDRKKPFELRVEVPVADMSRPGDARPRPRRARDGRARAAPSGPRCTRACSSSCGSTARRSCS